MHSAAPVWYTCRTARFQLRRDGRRRAREWQAAGGAGASGRPGALAGGAGGGGQGCLGEPHPAGVAADREAGGLLHDSPFLKSNLSGVSEHLVL